jgi:transposase
MSKALSVDLRDRVVAAIETGLSCRQAAIRFGVSASSAIRWHRSLSSSKRQVAVLRYYGAKTTSVRRGSGPPMRGIGPE